MLDFFAASRPKRGLGVIVSPLQESIGRRRRLAAAGAQGKWLAVVAIAVLGGCSWFSDEPTEPAAPVTINSTGTDTSGGTPAAPATPPVSKVDQAPQGLSSDSANAQYGDELTMPNIQAPRPVPPPPPVEAPPAAEAPASTETPAADGSTPASPAPEDPAPAAAPAEPAPEAPATEVPATEAPAPEAPAPQSRIDQAPVPGAAAMQPQVAMAFSPGGDASPVAADFAAD